MQTEPAAKRLERLRAVRQLGEHAQLNRAQQRLRGPEREACLQDLFRIRRLHSMESGYSLEWQEKAHIKLVDSQVNPERATLLQSSVSSAGWMLHS